MRPTLASKVKSFQQEVWAHYSSHRRDFPWRRTTNPYRILVSELMLQQTQTSRVVEKYRSFLRRFPTVQRLARATLQDVLLEWKGLGYNRRAKFLHQLARHVVSERGGRFPRDKKLLCELPGVGNYTAAAVRVFAFNLSDAVIETNVRAAYIKHFFPKRKSVRDSEILKLIELVGDDGQPREWNSALMDYGAYLKRQYPELGRRSSAYVKQSPFKGSYREQRARVLDFIVQRRSVSLKALTGHFSSAQSTHSLDAIIADLRRDELIMTRGKSLTIAS